MQTKDIIKKVEEYVMPIIEQNNYELVEMIVKQLADI